MKEIAERNILGQRVGFILTAAGRERLGLDKEDPPLRIRVTEIKSDNLTMEIVSLGGYDSEYTNYTIYGDEIEDIKLVAQPAAKPVTKEALKRWKEEKEQQ
jgi:hypothetical protein